MQSNIRSYLAVPVYVFSVLFLPSTADAREKRTINISWKCVSNQRDPRYPCKSSTQQIAFYSGQRVLLQEKGPLCLNESQNDRRTYNAFVNRNTEGSFLCRERGYDFEINYLARVRSTDASFEYVLNGNLEQKLGPGDADNGQRLDFKTRVIVKFNGSSCSATRSYAFSEYFGGIPRIANANYRYVSTTCSST